MPVPFPVTPQAACAAGGQLPSVQGGFNGQNSITKGGWSQHAIIWTPAPGAPGVYSYWHVDGEQGLAMFGNCTGQPLTCYSVATGAVGSGALISYQTKPPIDGVSVFANGVGFISGLAATVSGQLMILVNTVSGVWMWPANNTGAFNNATGTCCAVPTAGACCWANKNMPLTSFVPANYGMRGMVAAPQLPTCATAGYACALVGGVLTLPALPCAPGSFCPGGAPSALCPPGTWSGAMQDSCTGIACTAGQAGAAGSISPFTACVTCAAGTWSASGAGCVPCGANQTTLQGGASSASQCVCAAGLFDSSAGAGPLACAACPSDAVSAAGATACNCTSVWASWTPATASCYYPPSATPTPSRTPTPTSSSTISTTPTPSTTVSPSPSPSVTPTASTTSTPSLSASPTPSVTSSATPSQTQTPSTTPAPDVLLGFSFTLGGVGGQAVTPATVLQAQVQGAIISQLSALLGLPTYLVKIVNVTDIATGQLTRVSRRLAPTPGSQGVSVSATANLGKVPTQTGVVALTAALGGSNFTTALASVVQVLATSLGKPAAAFTSAPGPRPTLTNAPFSLPAPPLAAGGGGGATDNSAAVGGGVGGGIVAVLIVLWLFRRRVCSVPTHACARGSGAPLSLTRLALRAPLRRALPRSYQKHGALPCCRDFAEERRRREAEAAAIREAKELRQELDARDVGTSNPLGPTSGALKIRNLSQSNRALQDEVAAKAAQAEKAVSTPPAIARVALAHARHACTLTKHASCADGRARRLQESSGAGGAAERRREGRRPAGHGEGAQARGLPRERRLRPRPSARCANA